MFQEELALYTSDHLRSHIKAYLQAVDDLYTGNKKVPIPPPKTIEVASVVGGTMDQFDQILPAYGIDVLNVIASEDALSLWTHQYDGQINGLVSGSSASIVDAMIKRHAKAVETFVRNHELLHKLNSSEYTLVGFGAGNLEFSGAEDLGEVENTPVWLAAFSLNVSWFVSEDGPGQHG
jgi:hypothetical protein